MTKLQNYFGGSSGFEDLKKWMKINTDMTREFIAFMKERYELETDYSQKLTKLGNRMSKQFSLYPGTICNSIAAIGKDMESQAEQHKLLSTFYRDEVHKQIESISENFSKSRKTLEQDVEKLNRVLMDKRDEEVRMKRKAFTNMLEAERHFEAAQNFRREQSSGTGAVQTATEKDIAKLDKKAKSSTESAQKVEKEHYDACKKSEASRQDWEMSILKSMDTMQELEMDRLERLAGVLHKVCAEKRQFVGGLSAHTDALQRVVASANANSDLHSGMEVFGNKNPFKSEQFLFEVFAEHRENLMDPERRAASIRDHIAHVTYDLENANKVKEGTIKLLSVYEKTPNYTDSNNLESTRNQLLKEQSQYNFFRTIIYKLEVALADQLGCAKPVNILPANQNAACLDSSARDKSNLPQTIFRASISTSLKHDPTTIGKIASRVPSSSNSQSQSTQPAISRQTAPPSNSVSISSALLSSGSFISKPVSTSSKPSSTASSKMRQQHSMSSKSSNQNSERIRPNSTFAGRNSTTSTAPPQVATGGARGGAHYVPANTDLDCGDDFDSEEEQYSETVDGSGVYESAEPAVRRANAKSLYASKSSAQSSDYLKSRPLPAIPGGVSNNNSGGAATSPSSTAPSKSSSAAKCIGWCRANHSFTARNSDEMSISEGDTITILQRMDEHWIEAELNGKVGLVPSNYVTEF